MENTQQQKKEYYSHLCTLPHFLFHFHILFNQQHFIERAINAAAVTAKSRCTQLESRKLCNLPTAGNSKVIIIIDSFESFGV